MVLGVYVRRCGHDTQILYHDSRVSNLKVIEEGIGLLKYGIQVACQFEFHLNGETSSIFSQLPKCLKLEKIKSWTSSPWKFTKVTSKVVNL